MDCFKAEYLSFGWLGFPDKCLESSVREQKMTELCCQTMLSLTVKRVLALLHSSCVTLDSAVSWGLTAPTVKWRS